MFAQNLNIDNIPEQSSASGKQVLFLRQSVGELQAINMKIC